MRQHKYQLINTVRISVTEEFHWVKCPSSTDLDRSCLLQSYTTNSAQTNLESVRWEIDKLLMLSHPNLQSVIDVFATTDSLHIVQELEKWECAINRVPYTPAQAKSLLQEIIPVLSYLHDRGITHGNISHETILVDDLDRHILTNFLAIADLITEVGGDTYPRLRSQLDLIPVKNMPTGREWDLYSLGVTTIALLTDRDYQYLYDPSTKKWEWENYVDCSEELTKTIDRLLGQEKKPHREKIESGKEPIGEISNLDVRKDNFQPEYSPKVSTFFTTSAGKLSPNLYRSIIGILLFSVLGLASYLVWGKYQESNLTDVQLQSFPQNGTLTVGYLNRTPSRDRSPAQKP
jgi:serine/threonine protein kinase